MQIRFGSDGFRGVIGKEFTREAVTRIVLAAAQYADEHEQRSEHIPVGYDTRFLSREMAQLACRLLELAEVRSMLATDPCPSPYISFMAFHTAAPLGLQFTASHNPYFYNGVKLKSREGGSIDPALVQRIEHAANELELPATPPSASETELFDFSKIYLRLTGEAVGTAGSQPIAVDYMHGAAAKIYGESLRQRHNVRAELRVAADPLFGGGKPEPLEPLLGELKAAVSAAPAGTVGLAFDGDGDRLAVVDEAGHYLQSHEIFALLLDHLAQAKPAAKIDGQPLEATRIVTTVSFSGLLGRIADSHGLDVTEVPVGFKHVAAEMLKGDVLIGGEESGGAAFGHYLPERDALVMALTLLKAKHDAGGTLREMLDWIYARFGRPCFVHIDAALDAARHAALRDRVGAVLDLGSLAGDAVVSSSDRDGVKLRTAGGWVLVRASGTEPLARFYAEGETEAQARAYIAAVQAALS